MAFTVTQRITSNSGTTAQASRTTASFTPAASSRLFLFAAGQRDGHSSARSWSISDSISSSWTLVDESTLRIWEATPNYETNVICWYTDIGGSPAARTITVDASAGNEFYAIIAFDVTGYDTGTPFAQNSVDNGAAVSPASSSQSGTLTLGSAPTSGNLVVAMFGAGADGGGGFATPTGYTALTNQNQAYCQAAVFYHVTTTTAAVTSSDLGQTVGNWGGIIFEMTLAGSGAQSIAPDLLTNTSTVHSPTVNRGAVALAPDSIASVTAVYQPTVTPGTVVVSPDAITSTAAVHEPTVTVGTATIAPDTIASTATVHQPTIVPGAVALAPDTIASTATAYEPTLTAEGAVSPDHFVNTSTVYEPTVTPGAVAIAPAPLTNTSTVYVPTVTPGVVTIAPNTIASSTAFYSPTITTGAVTVAPDYLINTSTVYQPTIATSGVQNIDPAHLTNTSTIYSVTISGGTTGGNSLKIGTISDMVTPVIIPDMVTPSIIPDIFLPGKAQ